MKKFTFILTVILMLAGCRTSTFFTVDTYLFDLRKYAEKGFYMSFTGINQNYMPLGEITVVCQDGYDINTVRLKGNEGYEYGVLTKESKKIECKESLVLEQLYNNAKAIGADGIINIEFNKTQGKGLGNKKEMTATGLAVKIN